MNADAFRHYYDYHFDENRKIWDRHIGDLTQEQFTQPVHYSTGSVRNQIVHMMNVDAVWFSDLRGPDSIPLHLDNHVDDRAAIRTHWDEVERMMRAYLADLRDEMLLRKPIAEGEDKDLMLWQILLHVVNHGTDHRAQLLRVIHDYGQKTGPQDYVFYAYDHP